MNDTNSHLDDQICGVGLSVRFNSHLISVWHRYADKQASIDGILATVLEDIPRELTRRPDSYFYKKHADHAGFKGAPELGAVLAAQKRRIGGRTGSVDKGGEDGMGEVKEHDKDDKSDEGAEAPEMTVTAASPELR